MQESTKRNTIELFSTGRIPGCTVDGWGSRQEGPSQSSTHGKPGEMPVSSKPEISPVGLGQGTETPLRGGGKAEGGWDKRAAPFVTGERSRIRKQALIHPLRAATHLPPTLPSTLHTGRRRSRPETLQSCSRGLGMVGAAQGRGAGDVGGIPEPPGLNS